MRRGLRLSAEEGVEAEAEAVAQWLKHEVIGQEVLIERDGRVVRSSRGCGAVIPDIHAKREYLGALRRHGCHTWRRGRDISTSGRR